MRNGSVSWLPPQSGAGADPDGLADDRGLFERVPGVDSQEAHGEQIVGLEVEKRVGIVDLALLTLGNPAGEVSPGTGLDRRARIPAPAQGWVQGEHDASRAGCSTSSADRLQGRRPP